MRSFESELRAILGWHDGRSLHLTQAAATDPMVISHEGVHAHIFGNSPDGVLLSTCLNDLKFRPNSRSAEEAALVDAYFDKCRNPHESAATYMGIKVLDVEAHADEISRLPPDYLAWYKNYEGYFDGICESTFIHFIFARAVSIFIFSSNGLRWFVENEFDFSVLADARFWPDERQRRFSVWWEEEGRNASIQFVRELLLEHEVLSAVAFPQGDDAEVFGVLSREGGWPKDLALGKTIEAYLISFLYEFLIVNSPLESLSSDSDEYAEIVQSTFPLIEGWGFKPHFTRGGTPAKPVGEEGLHERLNEYLTAARSQFHITSLANQGRRARATRIELEDGYPLEKIRSSIMSFVFPEIDILEGNTHIELFTAANIDRNVAGVGRDVKFSGHLQCDGRTAINILGNFMYDRYFGMTEVGLLRILAPFEGYRATEGRSVVYTMLHTHPALPRQSSADEGISFEPRRMIHDLELFWYVRDEWPETLEVAQRAKASILIQSMTVAGFPECVINVLHMEGKPGYFLKVLPLRTAYPLVKHQRELVKSGRLQLIEGEEAEALSAVATGAAGAAFVYWNTL